jgi:hypothetical protein
MALGPVAVGRFLGEVHIVPMDLLLVLDRIPYFPSGFPLGLFEYSFLVFVQWFVVGLFLAFPFIRLTRR